MTSPLASFKLFSVGRRASERCKRYAREGPTRVHGAKMAFRSLPSRPEAPRRPLLAVPMGPLRVRVVEPYKWWRTAGARRRTQLRWKHGRTSQGARSSKALRTFPGPSQDKERDTGYPDRWTFTRRGPGRIVSVLVSRESDGSVLVSGRLREAMSETTEKSRCLATSESMVASLFATYTVLRRSNWMGTISKKSRTWAFR